MAVYRVVHSTRHIHKSSAESDVETNEVFMYDGNVINAKPINGNQVDNKNVI
ncbi:hypothetical protein [Peribacillus muralis]|uniref:hypothetical protein n=1 Tax=Peribacillus muralis TaxID=264697 RepID=UPI000A766728|nr:hypothetical protein [Peribacillus muralis]